MSLRRTTPLRVTVRFTVHERPVCPEFLTFVSPGLSSGLITVCVAHGVTPYHPLVVKATLRPSDVPYMTNFTESPTAPRIRIQWSVSFTNFRSWEP